MSLREAMEGSPRFIQIAVAAVPHRECPDVYALDDDGGVWMLGHGALDLDGGVDEPGKWMPLTDERGERRERSST